MVALTILLSSLTTGSLAFYLACAYFTQQFFRNPSKFGEPTKFSQASGLLGGVSLLVPCCGLDEGAWENWTSLCQQDYPEYEILFGIVDPQDPAIPVLEKLQTTYPDRVQLFTGLKPLGANHKTAASVT